MGVLGTHPLLQKHWEDFTNVYGGKKAFLRSLFFSAKTVFGGFSTYRRINWLLASRVIFVCHGNICRSPYAEYKFRLLGGHGISAGLEAKSGNQAYPRAQKVASDRGVQLDSHRTNNISNVSLCSGDLLVAFEPAHAALLYNRVRNERDIQVTLLGLWSPQPWSVYLHDPYGLPEKYFDNCFHRIDLALNGLLSQFEAKG
jgi:protein-tyrosine phosphatase